MKYLKNLLIGGLIAVSAVLPGQTNKKVNISDYNPTPVTQVPKNWKEGRPYWDMLADQDSIQALSRSKRTLEYQINPFHQPNEIYRKETSHGGGDYDGFGIGQSDVDAAQAGTNHYSLDVTGDNIVNAEDATEIGNFINNTIPVLQSHWNFLSENEKLSWFTKIANIYSVHNKQYIENYYDSGRFATELVLKIQGYNKNIADFAGGVRAEIPEKYNEGIEFNGRGNIPIYFVNMVGYDNQGNAISGHGMNALLIGDNPLNFHDWIWIEPQIILIGSSS